MSSRDLLFPNIFLTKIHFRLLYFTSGQTTRESPELTRESISEPSDLAELTREENISHPSDFGARADSKMNESTESIESGLVGFHFSPPAMLLRPVPRTSPPCLDTNSETIQGNSFQIHSIDKSLQDVCQIWCITFTMYTLYVTNREREIYCKSYSILTRRQIHDLYLLVG